MKENNKISGIKFEEFPGDKKSNVNKKHYFSKGNVKLTLLILLFAFLFIFSSFLNKRVVDFYFTK